KLSQKGVFKNRNYLCDTCGKSFVHSCELKKHWERVHNSDGSRRFQCVHCGKCYQAIEYLKRHEKLHSDVSYSCSDCDKTFQTTDNLKVHRINVHTDVWPYSCELCGKRFKMKGNMTKHKKRFHYKLMQGTS